MSSRKNIDGKRTSLQKNDGNARREAGGKAGHTHHLFHAYYQHLQHGGYLLRGQFGGKSAGRDRHFVYAAIHNTGGSVYVRARQRHLRCQGACQPRHGQGKQLRFLGVFHRRHCRRYIYRFGADIPYPLHAAAGLHGNYFALRKGLRLLGAGVLPLYDLLAGDEQQSALRGQSHLRNDRLVQRRRAEHGLGLRFRAHMQHFRR